MLRGAGLSLAEIGLLLADLDSNRDLASTRLDQHLTELEARPTGRRFLIRHIHAILREEDHPMFPIQTRHVPAQRVMSIQRRRECRKPTPSPRRPRQRLPPTCTAHRQGGRLP
jgi:hypothetical protein